MGYRYLRVFRQNHGISTVELAKYAGIPQQLISAIELGKLPVGAHRRRLIVGGLAQIIRRREDELLRLQTDFEQNKAKLLHFEEDTS